MIDLKLTIDDLPLRGDVNGGGNQRCLTDEIVLGQTERRERSSVRPGGLIVPWVRGLRCIVPVPVLNALVVYNLNRAIRGLLFRIASPQPSARFFVGKSQAAKNKQLPGATAREHEFARKMSPCAAVPCAA